MKGLFQPMHLILILNDRPDHLCRGNCHNSAKASEKASGDLKKQCLEKMKIKMKRGKRARSLGSLIEAPQMTKTWCHA